MSNSGSDFDFDMSELNDNRIYLRCVDLKEMDRINNKSDDTIFPSRNKEKVFWINLSAAEFAKIGSPSVGSVIKITLDLIKHLDCSSC